VAPGEAVLGEEVLVVGLLHVADPLLREDEHGAVGDAQVEGLRRL
jgi:hypothetical protein